MAAPRTVAENLRTSLLRTLDGQYQGLTASFQTLEDAPEPVVVKGRPLPAVVFSILVENNTGTATTPPTPAAAGSQP